MTCAKDRALGVSPARRSVSRSHADATQHENDNTHPGVHHHAGFRRNTFGTLKFLDGFPDQATAKGLRQPRLRRGIKPSCGMPGASPEAIRRGFAKPGADNKQTVLLLREHRAGL